MSSVYNRRMPWVLDSDTEGPFGSMALCMRDWLPEGAAVTVAVCRAYESYCRSFGQGVIDGGRIGGNWRVNGAGSRTVAGLDGKNYVGHGGKQKVFGLGMGSVVGVSKGDNGVREVVDVRMDGLSESAGVTEERTSVFGRHDTKSSVATGGADDKGVTTGSGNCAGNTNEEKAGDSTVEFVTTNVVGDSGAATAEVESPEVFRGKHYCRNKAKRELAKIRRKSVGLRQAWESGADLKDVCPSLSGSVCTVDTRTAEEIEAVRTLAARRVVENQVAKKLAELRLVSLNNKDKTEAVLRLEAARMEQRINDARARSQASFKKCDQSLKSLGSTGSAGEYALKQEVKKGKDAEVKLEYSQRQLRMFYEHATPHVRQMVADIPEPTFEPYIDVFGDCPSEFDEEEAQAYYDDLSLRTAEAGLI